MEIAYNVLVKIVLLVSFGFFLKKVNCIDKNIQTGLNRLLLNVILPVTIFSSSQMEVSREVLYNMRALVFLSVGYYIFAWILAHVCFGGLKMTKEKKQMAILMVMFANVGFIGFPIANELFGVEGTLYTVIYNLMYQLVFFTYGVLTFQSKKTFSLKIFLQTPATAASFLCLLFFGMHIQIPAEIGEAIGMVGNMTTPISLILIGCMLADLKLSDLLDDMKMYVVIILRMAVCPAVVYMAAKALRLTKGAVGTSVILMGMPVASLIAIYAEEYHTEEKYVAKTVVVSMLAMLISLPAWIKILL